MPRKKSKTKKKENPLYVQLTYSEGVEGRKKVLLSEENLLKILQAIKNYQKYRIKELQKKKNLRIKLKQFKAEIRKLEKIIPEVKIPKRFSESSEEFEESETESFDSDSGIESQLKEIQRKLRKLKH